MSGATHSTVTVRPTALFWEPAGRNSSTDCRGDTLRVEEPHIYAGAALLGRSRLGECVPFLSNGDSSASGARGGTATERSHYALLLIKRQRHKSTTLMLADVYNELLIKVPGQTFFFLGL